MGMNTYYCSCCTSYSGWGRWSSLELRPQMGLVYQSIMEEYKMMVEWQMAAKNGRSRRKSSSCQRTHHKCHMHCTENRQAPPVIIRLVIRQIHWHSAGNFKRWCLLRSRTKYPTTAFRLAYIRTSREPIKYAKAQAISIYKKVFTWTDMPHSRRPRIAQHAVCNATWI